MATLRYPQNDAMLSRLGHLPTSAFLRDENSIASLKAISELHKAVNRAHEIIFSATTVFPFTLFPDTVTVDREKVNIANRIFFRVAEVISTRIEDILNVTADVGPFFGSLKITSRFFETSKPYSINYLWRQDALRIKRIIQGYLIARKKKIDCSVLSAKQLRQELDRLGQTPPEGVED